MKNIFISIFFLAATSAFSQSISLTGSVYTQSFDALSNTAGSTTNNLTITGWLMTETGGGARDNEQYAVDVGGSNTGDTYSYGSTGSTDRALGSLQSGTLIPNWGAVFTNNTGATITTLRISYTGEQWRLGTAARTDEIDFQYSTDATSLTTGTWTNVAALNFVTPNMVTVGAKDGNATANRTSISATISGLGIVNGASFYIRWTDFNTPANADDGLAVDNFSIETNVPLPVTLINFAAIKENKTSKISWTTIEEINTAAFKVQRSANGSTNWQTIATVKASGQSSTKVNYQVYDAIPGTGDNFYRLMSLDADDKFTFSATRRVNFNMNYTMGVYPNPVRNSLHITTDNATGINGELIVENLQGQVILRKHIATGNPLFDLQVGQLKSGLYLFKILHNNGDINIFKVVRE